MEENNRKTLALRARERDADAFSQLVNAYLKDWYRVAYACLRNDTDAADAIQDAILESWEHIHRLKQPQYFKTWFIRILLNKCHDLNKHRSRLTPLEKVAESGQEDSSDLEFQEMLSYLDEKYRTVIVLFYYEGYKTREIADLLHISESTVQTRLQRAREKLKLYYEI